MKCKRCGSENTVKAGIHVNNQGRYQRHQCKACGHLFVGESVGEATKRTVKE
jgi:transposase-like protein